MVSEPARSSENITVAPTFQRAISEAAAGLVLVMSMVGGMKGVAAWFQVVVSEKAVAGSLIGPCASARVAKLAAEPVPRPSVVAMAARLVSSRMERAADVRSVVAIAPEPVK